MEKFKNLFKKFLGSGIAVCVILAFVLNLTIESFARHSLAKGIDFFLSSPLVFLFNTMIIFTTLSIALIIKRRLFVYIIISALWLALGITNGIILVSRMTPFTTKDLAVFKDGMSIIAIYLSNMEIIFLAAGILVGVILLILLFVFGPKCKTPINYKRAAAMLAVIGISMTGVTEGAIKTGVVDTFFANLAYAYRDYGVPYCFINTWLNTGIRQPINYSDKAVKGLFKEGELGENSIAAIASEKETDNKKRPNIIILQMESFIDPLQVIDIEYSKDPIPNYRKLLSEYSSGYLTVPAVGAGTANTEFEMLTGMSVKFFGPGEYPYKSILLEKTCESVPYQLKNIGYTATAIHNHRGAFYGRNKVFKSLGFDRFTSLEYMNHVVKTPKNWAKDEILTEQILDALDTTDTRDFVYACSVQGHGVYPTEKVIVNPEITVTKAPTEKQKWQYEYYTNQIYEMDAFIGELLGKLEEYKEDTVVIIYGDHLPALDMKEEELKCGNLFNTQYVIWSNFPMKKENKDLYSYQVMANVYDKLGYHMGVMTKYHQSRENTKEYNTNKYRKGMKLLEYDMLYGKNYVFGGESPYKPSELQMGIKPIKVTDVVRIGSKLYIKGENFTEYSKISLDGKILKTIYLGSSILGLQEEVDLNSASKMKVSQVEKQKEILSTTE